MTQIDTSKWGKFKVGDLFETFHGERLKKSDRIEGPLIGRTNVGKSALYNRLVGKREALVCKEVNTTRDRREGRVFFCFIT